MLNKNTRLNIDQITETDHFTQSNGSANYESPVFPLSAYTSYKGTKSTSRHGNSHDAD